MGKVFDACCVTKGGGGRCREPGAGPKGEGGTRWGVGPYGRHMHWQRGKRDYKLVKIAADPKKKSQKNGGKKSVTKPNNGPKLALALPLALLLSLLQQLLLQLL